MIGLYFEPNITWQRNFESAIYADFDEISENIDGTNKTAFDGIGNSGIVVETEFADTSDEDGDIYPDNAEKDSTDILQKVVSNALEFGYVLGARAFEWNDCIIVGAITEPFYLKSERDGAINDMQTELQTLSDDKTILVSFDVHVYRKIRDNISDEEKEKLYNIVKPY